MRFVNSVSGRFRARGLPTRQCQHQAPVVMGPRPAGADLLELGAARRSDLGRRVRRVKRAWGCPWPAEEGGRTYEFEPLPLSGSRR